MKTKLRCLLLGHNFLAKSNIWTDGWTTTWDVQPIDWCTKCGLTKQELCMVATEDDEEIKGE